MEATDFLKNAEDKLKELHNEKTLVEKLQENFVPDVAVKLMQAKQSFHDLKLNMKNLKVKLAMLQTLQDPQQELDISDETLKDVTHQLQNLKDQVEEKQNNIEEKCKTIQAEYEKFQEKHSILRNHLQRLKQKQTVLASSNTESQAMDTD